MTNKDKGKEFINRAFRILNRELKMAYEDNDISLIIRRAQEVVELSIKGALIILGIEYPKNHDPSKPFVVAAKKKIGDIDEKILKKISDISSKLAEMRAPAFYGEKDYTLEEAKQAYADAHFVFEQINKILKLKKKEGIHRKTQLGTKKHHLKRERKN